MYKRSRNVKRQHYLFSRIKTSCFLFVKVSLLILTWFIYLSTKTLLFVFTLILKQKTGTISFGTVKKKNEKKNLWVWSFDGIVKIEDLEEDVPLINTISHWKMYLTIILYQNTDRLYSEERRDV